MSCNCKDDKINELLDGTNETPKINLAKAIGKYTFKILAFLVMLLLLPVINLVIIWFIFQMLVLNKNIDVKPILIAIGKKFKKEDNDGDDNDYDNLTEDDVIMVDVEDITNNQK